MDKPRFLLWRHAPTQGTGWLLPRQNMSPERAKLSETAEQCVGESDKAGLLLPHEKERPSYNLFSNLESHVNGWA